MATYSCILAWEIPWAKEPRGPQSMGSQVSDIATKPSAVSSPLPLQYGIIQTARRKEMFTASAVATCPQEDTEPPGNTSRVVALVSRGPCCGAQGRVSGESPGTPAH